MKTTELIDQVLSKHREVTEEYRLLEEEAYKRHGLTKPDPTKPKDPAQLKVESELMWEKPKITAKFIDFVLGLPVGQIRLLDYIMFYGRDRHASFDPKSTLGSNEETHIIARRFLEKTPFSDYMKDAVERAKEQGVDLNAY